MRSVRWDEAINMGLRGIQKRALSLYTVCRMGDRITCHTHLINCLFQKQSTRPYNILIFVLNNGRVLKDFIEINEISGYIMSISTACRPMLCLAKATLCENCTFLLEHFKGTKHGGNPLCSVLLLALNSPSTHLCRQLAVNSPLLVWISLDPSH